MSAGATDRKRLHVIDQLFTTADITAWNIASVHRNSQELHYILQLKNTLCNNFIAVFIDKKSCWAINERCDDVMPVMHFLICCNHVITVTM